MKEKGEINRRQKIDEDRQRTEKIHASCRSLIDWLNIAMNQSRENLKGALAVTCYGIRLGEHWYIDCRLFLKKSCRSAVLQRFDLRPYLFRINVWPNPSLVCI